MISAEQSRALGEYLAAQHGAQVLPSDAAPVAVARGLLDALGALVPGAAPILDAIRARAQRVSVTLATPWTTLIVLSAEAVTTSESYVTTIAHEAEHARQITALGAVQSVADYLGSGELRAAREGSAYVVGLWARYLVTGVVPTVEDAMASLGSGLYHLAPEELELGRGVVTSGVETIRVGAVPPYQVASEVLHWLRTHAPEAIIPEVHHG